VSSTEQDEGLKKVIGVRSLAANAVNLTVGAGIFALPAVVAAYLGAASFLAYILCALLIVMVQLCFVEVGSKISVTGGVYVYIEKAFGPLAGFLANILFSFGYCIMADAAVANVLADSLATFFPFFNESIIRVIFFLLIFGGVGLINVRGVQQGNTLVEIITLAKLLPLLILIVVGFFFIDTNNLHVTTWPSVKSLGEVSLILFFAFAGVEASLSVSGEIKNPKRTIPRGILLGVFIIFIFYMLIQFVAQGVLGEELALQKEAPLTLVASTMLGTFGKIMIVAGAAISCFGLISGDILSTSRLPYAAARDGLLPKFLSSIHPRYATPHVAILFYAGVGFILSISGGFRQLAVLASSAMLIMYVGVILATIKLRKIKPDPSAFVIPGGLVIPILALLATGWFLSNLASPEIIGLAIFLAFFTVVYMIMKFVKTRQSPR
jgi:APA family basic amino acid/polyamine antiporter